MEEGNCRLAQVGDQRPRRPGGSNLSPHASQHAGRDLAGPVCGADWRVGRAQGIHGANLASLYLAAAEAIETFILTSNTARIAMAPSPSDELRQRPNLSHFHQHMACILACHPTDRGAPSVYGRGAARRSP
jgi:hypothetical protein